jgi:hypothetical protein
MSKRPPARPSLEQAVKVSLACRGLGELGDGFLLAVAGKRATREQLSNIERELLFRSRQLVEILEQATPHRGPNVVDVRVRLRRRAIARALEGNSPPRPAA